MVDDVVAASRRGHSLRHGAQQRTHRGREPSIGEPSIRTDTGPLAPYRPLMSCPTACFTGEADDGDVNPEPTTRKNQVSTRDYYDQGCKYVSASTTMAKSCAMPMDTSCSMMLSRGVEAAKSEREQSRNSSGYAGKRHALASVEMLIYVS